MKWELIKERFKEFWQNIGNNIKKAWTGFWGRLGTEDVEYIDETEARNIVEGNGTTTQNESEQAHSHEEGIVRSNFDRADRVTNWWTSDRTNRSNARNVEDRGDR